MKKLTTFSALVLSSISMQVFADVQPPAVLMNPPTGLIKQAMPPQPVQQQQNQQQVPSTEIDKLSYSLGVQLGQGLKSRGMNINLDVMIQGIKDGYNGQKLQMNEQSIRETLVNYQRKVTAEMTEKFNKAKDANVQTSTDFLAKNKNQPGVVTTPSGLQYQVIKAGTGAQQPKDTDVIVVNYAGTTIDGKEFDSSYKRGEPMTAQLKYMIPGWVEALKMMKKGSVWKLYIPANLAYGERGAPPVIGPNQTLIFQVELLDVKRT